MVDLALQMGLNGNDYFVGLVVGKAYAPDVDTATRYAQRLTEALGRQVVVWVAASDAPIAPETIRAHAKKVLADMGDLP